MDDEFLIQVEILGKRYPLRIPRKDEEIMRKAAKLVEEKYDLYVSKYDVQDLENSGRELIALVAFDLAYRSLKSGEEADLLPFVERVGRLNTELSEYLKSDKNL